MPTFNWKRVRAARILIVETRIMWMRRHPEKDTMRHDERAQANNHDVAASARRWQQVLAFGCLPDEGCQPKAVPADNAAPRVLFDVIP